MDNSQIEMLNALCVSAFCGFFAFFVYDILAIITFEIVSRKSKAVSFVLDILFILTFTLTHILLIYYLCDGKVRGVFISVMLLGALLYRKMIRKAANRAIKLLIAPIKILIGFFSHVIKKIIYFLMQSIAKIRIKLYNKGVK